MGTVKLRKWDSAEHLKTEEDIALYFEACLEEAGDEAAFIAKSLGAIARARHDPTGEGHRAWARKPIQGAVGGRQSELCGHSESDACVGVVVACGAG